MKIKQKVQLIFASFLVVLGAASFAITPQTFATAVGNNGCETDTAIIKCTNVTVSNSSNSSNAGLQNTGLWSILLTAINVLTAGVGIAAVGGLVYGAILYTSAGGSPEQVKKAIGIITNVVIGIFAYALMFGVLNFLIPGGLFN
jgi:hypothetical protein